MTDPVQLEPRTYEGLIKALAEAREAVAKLRLRPISETPPKDRPILAWCDHEADPHHRNEEAGSLTLYAAHYEGLDFAPTGWHILEWGGGWEGSKDYGGGHLPDWWYVAGSEFEIAANPTMWMELPPDQPRTEKTEDAP